jgi:hypothetical protein
MYSCRVQDASTSQRFSMTLQLQPPAPVLNSEAIIESLKTPITVCSAQYFSKLIDNVWLLVHPAFRPPFLEMSLKLRYIQRATASPIRRGCWVIRTEHVTEMRTDNYH